jgi:hypothetical protein
VVLGLLAVIGEWKISAALGQRNTDRGDQRNTFVGRTKQHIELDAARLGGFGVKFRQSAQ